MASSEKRIKEIEKTREFLNKILTRIEDFSFGQIWEIEDCFERSLSIEDIEFCVLSGFDELQMYYVRQLLRERFFGKQIKKYITPQLNSDKLKEIAGWAEEIGLYFEEFMKEFKEEISEFSHRLIHNMQMGILEGLSWEKIKEFVQLCKEKNYIKSLYETDEILEGIFAGLSQEELRYHIKPGANREQLKQIISTLIAQKGSDLYRDEQISSFLSELAKSGKFTEKQLREIKLGFLNGLTLEQVRICADPKVDTRRVRLLLQLGFLREQVEFYKSCYKESYYLAREVFLWLRGNLPFEQIKFLVKSGFCASCVETLRKRFQRLPRKRVEFYFKKLKSYLDAGFNPGQAMQIILGYLDGLSKEQINFYARHEFSEGQMSVIRLAYVDGLSQEEIEFFVKPEFNDAQMAVISNGFRYGLPLEQIKKFAKPEIPWFDMRQIFFGYLWGLPEEVIEFYMNPKLPGLEDLKDTWGRDSLAKVLRIAFLKGFTIPEIEYVWKNLLDLYRDKLFGIDNTGERYINEMIIIQLEDRLEAFSKDKQTRAKIRALASIRTELLKNWKRESSVNKSERKRRTL